MIGHWKKLIYHW